ncbi:MAG: hypothetical protein JSS60_05700 [Verrucomicrobia bacterium]|nr:hypothetical protein [Verrucomicrobiota bacterium]
MNLALNKKNIVSGIVSGLIAGIVLGCMMIRMGIMANVGAMMGMPHPVAGFFFHLIYSGLIGLIFGLVFYSLAKDFFTSAIWGVIYGVIWWFLGTLTLAQMMMGLPVSWNAIAMLQGMHMLVGQLVFGIVLGISYFWLNNRK